jgi:hypothetical protein
MDKGEPPSSSHSKASPFLVGRNSHGEWVVRDKAGLRGGLFVNRAEALKFAMFENGRRPQAVILVPETLELNLTSCNSSTDRTWSEATPLRRQAA